MGVAEQMAVRAASQRAEELLTPLMSEDDDSSSEGDDSTSTFDAVKQTPLQKLKTIAVYVVLGGGIAASAASFVVSPSTLVFIAGGIAIANAPYSAFKEMKMSKIPTLRSMNNALREDANRLEGEVDILSGEIDALIPEANRAKEVEEQLRGIAEQQSVNVNKLVDLVKQNEEILAKMKDNLRQRIVQDIISIVVQSDKDNDQTIDKNEGKVLALKIRLQLQEYGVEFDSEKFMKVIEKNPTVPGVIAVVQRLLPTGKEEQEEDDEDIDYDSDFDSDEESDDEDEMYDMFYMSEEAEMSRGSVAGARATIQGGQRGRVSLVNNRVTKTRRVSRRLRSNLKRTDASNSFGKYD
ncbi:hypothetical protein ACHAXS_001395 [Conticribra weissflogii]